MQKQERNGCKTQKVNMIELKGFNEKLNEWLRRTYLKSLARPVSYDNGATIRPRVRHIKMWESLIPFKDPIDILTQVKTPRQDIWFWSDLHFGHKNIISFSDRPFVDIPTMDETLIQNFNRLVKPDDISIWVGDVSFKNIDESKALINRLNGYKILVLGNHDFNKKKVKYMGFDEVHVVYNLTIGDTAVAFTHYPMDNLPAGWINVHGHLHKNGHHADEVPSTTHINVNCEFQDYKPINLGTLIEKVAEFNKLNREGKSKRAEIDYTEYD